MLNRRRERGLVFLCVCVFFFTGICPRLLCTGWAVSLPPSLRVGVRVGALSQGPRPGARQLCAP